MPSTAMRSFAACRVSRSIDTSLNASAVLRLAAARLHLHPQRMDRLRLGDVEPLEKMVRRIVVHQKTDRTIVHAEDRQCPSCRLLCTVCSIKPVAAQRDDDVRIRLRVAVALGEFALAPPELPARVDAAKAGFEKRISRRSPTCAARRPAPCAAGR